MLSKEKKEELEKLSVPLIEFINENYDPHHVIVIKHDGVEVFCGELGIINDFFIK